MKTVISVGGRFHAFHLARQLLRYNYLKNIFTSFPYLAVKKERIPKERIVCLPMKEMLERFVEIIPGTRNYSMVQHYSSSLFDRQVSRLITDCDVFFGWAGFSLFTIRKLQRNYNAKTFLERSSTHIEFQRDILKEEENITGMKLDLPVSKVINKELEEYHEADYILVPSGFSKSTFISRGFSENKLILVNYGADLEVFRPLPKKDKIFRVIYVGVCLRKGIHYLLQAVHEMKLKNFEVLLIGNANDDSRQVLRKYRGDFKYIGGISHHELARYYSQGSVFVLPSLEEGFSLAMLEAMACGLPVIVSEHTGAKDIIRQGREGFVIPIRDSNVLKEKISYLYENQEICREMGINARKKIESSFTWDRYGEKIINFLQNNINR